MHFVIRKTFDRGRRMLEDVDRFCFKSVRQGGLGSGRGRSPRAENAISFIFPVWQSVKTVGAVRRIGRSTMSE